MLTNANQWKVPMESQNKFTQMSSFWTTKAWRKASAPPPSRAPLVPGCLSPAHGSATACIHRVTAWTMADGIQRTQCGKIRSKNQEGEVALGRNSRWKSFIFQSKIRSAEAQKKNTSLGKSCLTSAKLKAFPKHSMRNWVFACRQQSQGLALQKQETVETCTFL